MQRLEGHAVNLGVGARWVVCGDIEAMGRIQAEEKDGVQRFLFTLGGEIYQHIQNSTSVFGPER